VVAAHGGIWLGDGSIAADGVITPDGEPHVACGDLIGHLKANLARNTDKEVNGGQCKVCSNPGGNTS
jgi:hypothetical protein